MKLRWPTRPSPLHGVGAIVLLLAAWQGMYWLVGEVALRSPAETIAYTSRFVLSGAFDMHVVETMRAFAAALAIAVAAGLGIGFLLGMSRFARAVFEPVLVALYSIPKITLYPIVLLAFGLGMPSKIAFGAIHGIVPIAVFTINGLRNVRPVLMKTSRVLRLKPLQAIWSVLLPAALPEIFSGLRIGFSLTLIGTLLGEMFASQRGLGYLLMNAIGLHNVDLIMAVTLLLVLFAASVSIMLLALDRRLHRRQG